VLPNSGIRFGSELLDELPPVGCIRATYRWSRFDTVSYPMAQD
jgi:hypothetical protein